jgi:cleavage stimulation factor subunit 3
MLNVEALWDSYVSYEQTVILPDSAHLLAEKLEEFGNVRRVSHELEGIMRGLNKGALSIPPTGTPSEIKQVIATWLC